MRVLQIIDSLRSGGAEQMAVSYANALSGKIEGSYLCCTRREGLLNAKIAKEVGYVFLNKKHSFDLKAFLKLRRFVVKNEIDLLQAHSTSWFLAVMLKITLCEVKLVWHDHYGRELKNRPAYPLKAFSGFLDGVISVNPDLKNWALDTLKAKKVIFFKNFLPSISLERGAKLNGENDLKIICVANFRPQKDHLTLLKAFQRLLLSTKEKVSLHLIGKDNQDEYSEKVQQFIREHALKDVHIYGEQESIGFLLDQADIAVLSSSSEGLPVALLEYGRAGLPVVCTNVGQCEEVIGGFGKLVEPEEPNALMKALLQYVNNEQQRSQDARNFQQKVLSEYSEELIIPQVIRFMQSL
ncbi:glycosyltransferase [Salinimicrobium gaetbulicola]|uniref:Glycosyltransferase n=1 Tax=Salinimicrobium gaetbulicola TaxID=999702 RepID=A0ABW3IKC3_9FLAO